MMVHAALKTEHTRQAARGFAHTAKDNSCCHPSAPAHLLRLQSSWVEVRLVRVLCDIARIACRYATTSKYIGEKDGAGCVRNARRHLRRYLLPENHENEHAPWTSPAASTCFEGGRPPPSVERTGRRSTHRRDGLAEICSKIAGRWRRECSLSSKAECCKALLRDPATSG